MQNEVIWRAILNYFSDQCSRCYQPGFLSVCRETQWPLDGAKGNRDTLWTPGVSHTLGSVLSHRHGAKLFTKPDLHFSFVSRPEGEPTGHVRREVQTFQRHQVHDQGGQVPGADINATGTSGPNHHETEGGGEKGWGLVHSLCLCISGLA